MALSIFEDKTKAPGESELCEALGETYPVWDEIKSFVYNNYPTALEEWKHSGKNYGWGFRLRDKKRVIIYLTPCEGHFKASLVLGSKATTQALSKNISNKIKTIIETAPVYAEGRGFRMDVKNADYLDDIKTLILIKLKN